MNAIHSFSLSFCFASALVVTAAPSANDIARLGHDLTPLGAEAAGNADGSIPAWDGGLVTPPASYTPGAHHPDPFASDQPLYTITAENAAQYDGRLTAGHLALLKAYPDYKLVVFPSHRTAS